MRHVHNGESTLGAIDAASFSKGRRFAGSGRSNYEWNTGVIHKIHKDVFSYRSVQDTYTSSFLVFLYVKDMLMTNIQRTVALVFGVVFLLVGILGFVPALTPGGALLGLFMVNGVHSVVHLSSES